MPFPELSDTEMMWVIQQVPAFIEGERDHFFATALPLSTNQKTALQVFFSRSVLESSRVVLSRHRIPNPPFYVELARMGFDPSSLPDFSNMAAITFVDIVVSHEPLTDKLLFHELVHVVQYAKLGLADFAAKYVSGFLKGGTYEAIPLERNAYELDARFAAEPRSAFSVEDEVQAWMAADKF